MTVKKYINKNQFRYEVYISDKEKIVEDVVTVRDCKKAVEMARKEEQDKALIAIDGTVTYIESEIENKRTVSAKKIFDVFFKLLNQ